MARYVVVGGLTFVVDLGLLVLLHGVVGLPLAVSTALAYSGAIVVNFGLNSAWTFTGQGAHGRGFARYMTVIVGNLIAAVVLVAFFVHLGLAYPLAKTVSTGASTVWTYVLYRVWVFRS